MGLDTRGVDEMLNSYFARRQGDLSYQLLQEDQDQALMLAILLELRDLNGETSLPGESGDEEAAYSAREVEATDEWEKLDLGWPIADLLIYEYDEPIEVAMADPDRGNHAIPLSASKSPTNFSPTNGLATSKVWYRLQDDATGPTTMVVVGFA